jgi:hypothetical protein
VRVCPAIASLSCCVSVLTPISSQLARGLCNPMPLIIEDAWQASESLTLSLSNIGNILSAVLL